MTRLYFEPIDVECKDGAPRKFVWRRKAHRVTVVLRRWMVRVDWWRDEVAREYYKVECENLGTYEIYCSTRTPGSPPVSTVGAGSRRARPGFHPAPPPSNPADREHELWFLERVYD